MPLKAKLTGNAEGVKFEIALSSRGANPSRKPGILSETRRNGRRVMRERHS